MLSLIITGIVVLIIISVLIILIRNNPNVWFWIFINLFFDPGGYARGFLGGDLFGPLNMSDVFIAGIVICIVYAKINWKVIYEDKFLIKFLSYLSIYFAYYYIVFGGLVPYINNDFNYFNFLIKNREFAYGIIILISIYVFSLKSLNYFYYVTLFFGVICLSMYLVTLFTGLNLIPVEQVQRTGHIGMMRISMISYGLFDLLFPLAIIAYLLSKKYNLLLKYKLWLYYSGIMMLITLVITLTRRTQIDIILSVIITVIILSYLFRTGKVREILKLVMPALVFILALYFTFPKYIYYGQTIAEDTYLILTTGKDSIGESDYRVSGTGDLDIVKEYIGNNILFGTGYSYLNWNGEYVTSTRGDNYAIAADAAGEVPIYYLLFGYGIFGAILLIPLYFMMVNLFFKLIKLLKLTLIYYLREPITIIFSIYFLLIIAGKFTYKIWNLSSDFTGVRLAGTAVFIGLGFALYRKIYLNIYLQNLTE